MNNSTVRPSNAHSFDKVANVNIPRSKFDLSHGYKTTLDAGYLVPVMIQDVLVGDTITCDLTQLTRLTTPIVPFMDNVRVTFHAFACPKRLLWDNFEDFWTGSHKGKLGTTHTTYPTCQLSRSDWSAGSVFDYLGIPQPATGKFIEVNALPLRMYNLVYNEWYRDENLIDPLEIDLSDDDSANSYSLLKRNKRKDYFTSALPFVQKGPDVTLPLGSSAPLKFESEDTSVAPFNGTFYAYNLSGQNHLALKNPPSFVAGGKSYTPVVDLSNATSATINSLREAFACQHLLERDARNGSRMVESIYGHYGVTCPDFRLQRPEYIGGGNVDFMVNAVPQTSGTQSSGTETPQGNLAAFAKSVGQVHFQYSAVEPCYIMVLASITSQLTYQQGLDRLWSKRVRTDEYWPEFAHLGEQPVYEREIFCDGSDTDSRIFGYQERFAEYRYFPSQITGKLRSSDPQSLDIWHLAQYFEEAPSLSKDFIEESPPIERVVAVQDEPQFVMDLWFKMYGVRPLPTYATPGCLDHF